MIVLDTHALLWWVAGDNALGPSAAKSIDHHLSAGEDITVSAISFWEIAMLIEKGRLVLSLTLEDWMDLVSSIGAVRTVPITPEVAVESVRLPGELHPDPADRMIVATARRLGAALVTKDKKLQTYPFVETVW